ncbi:MAG: HU family DNA-binding protein [Betaproteobacteria bacterium]|nr:HU family DNA-binding protein [Betaproteobacteria bacterium]
MASGRHHSRTSSLTRIDLADELGKQLGTSAAGKKVVHSFFDEIRKSLIAGERVQIHGLGSFRVVAKPARKVCNPKTGKKLMVPDQKALILRLSNKMRSQIRNADMIRPKK